MREIFILCGLPGSGKTTFAQSIEEAVIYDIDEWIQDGNLIQNLFPLIPNDDRIYILDGLFLLNDSYQKTLEFFKNDKVEFHYWIPNREFCLYNDQNRRNQKSTVTIRYANIEEPDIKNLKKVNFNITLIKHETKRKDD